MAYPLHVDLGDVGLPLEPWRGRGEEFGPSRAEATARVQAGGGGEIVMKVRIFVWEYHTDALRLADEVNECIKSCENLGDTVLDADVLTRPNPQASHGVEYLVVVKYEGHRRIISLPWGLLTTRFRIPSRMKNCSMLVPPWRTSGSLLRYSAISSCGSRSSQAEAGISRSTRFCLSCRRIVLRWGWLTMVDTAAGI